MITDKKVLKGSSIIRYSIDDNAMIGRRDDERISPAAISLITSANLLVIRTINNTSVTPSQVLESSLNIYWLIILFTPDALQKNTIRRDLLVLMTIPLHYNYDLLITLIGLAIRIKNIGIKNEFCH